MRVGPGASPSQSTGPTYGALGPAPTSRARSPTLAAWTPPVSQRYAPPPSGHATEAGAAADATTAHIPSLARRVTLGSLRLAPLLLVYVLVPYLGFQSLQSYGLVEGLPIGQVTIFGALLAVLSTVAYVARPTRAFGPISTVSSLGKVLYLVYFAGFAWAAISVAEASVRLDFGNLLLLLAIVPAFGVGAGLLTTIQDIRHPGERLRFDYPR